MKKYQNLVKRTITLIMPFILILGLIVNLIFPDKELSLVENRSLQKFPEIDKASIIDGSFETKFSSWFADQFVGRNGFIHLRYGLLKLLGQRKINNIYLCGSQLIENSSLPDQKQLARNLKAINTFSENHTDLKTTFLLVPNAVSVQNNRLPYLSDETNQNQIMDSIYKKLNKKINVVDVRNKLKEHRDDYKQMVVSTNFRGTLANGTGSIGIEDTINIFVNKNLNDYYVQESDNKIEGSIYDSSYIDSENQYSVFLGGNKSIQRIEMDNDSKRHLLLFKDSYANTFVQFLMNDYRTITIVDPRYYNDNIDKVMKDDLITDVMYLYNTNTFVEDSSLADVLGE